jgi:hypothetical protein
MTQVEPPPTEVKDDPDEDLSTDSVDDGIGDMSSVSTCTGTNESKAATNDNVRTQFARKETEQICWLRGIVMVVLLLATFMVSVVIFYSTRKSELEQFETQFGDHADKILDSFQTRLQEGIGAIDNLAVAFTSGGKSSTFQWPFATIPDFAVKAASALNIASANFVAFAPLVDDSQRQAWETFSLNRQAWVEEGLRYEQGNETHDGSPSARQRKVNEQFDLPRALQSEQSSDSHADTPVDFSQGIASTIYRMTEGTRVVEDNVSSYYPIWQHSPVNSKLVNFNLLSHWEFGEEAQVATISQSVVIGQVSEATSYNGQDDAFQVSGVRSGSDDPISNIYFPVFSGYDQPHELVAILVATIEWTRYLKSRTLISQSANGIRCVLANGCGQAYTYEVQDGQVVFLGEGDGHDPAFDYLEVSVDLRDLISSQGSSRLSYAGLTINDAFCPYSLHVFPSSSVARQYYTSKPTMYTVLVCVVFLFTSVVFVTYDFLVER